MKNNTIDSFIFLFNKQTFEVVFSKENIFHKNKIKKLFLEKITFDYLEQIKNSKLKSNLFHIFAEKYFYLFSIEFKVETSNSFKFKVNFMSYKKRNHKDNFFIKNPKETNNIEDTFKEQEEELQNLKKEGFLINFFFDSKLSSTDFTKELFYSNIFIFMFGKNNNKVKIKNIYFTIDKKVILLFTCNVDFDIKEEEIKTLIDRTILELKQMYSLFVYSSNFSFLFDGNNLLSLYRKNAYKYLFFLEKEKINRLPSLHEFEASYENYIQKINNFKNGIDSNYIFNIINDNTKELTIDLSSEYMNYIYYTHYKLAYDIFTKIIRESYKSFVDSNLKLIIVNSVAWFAYFMNSEEFVNKKILFNFNIENLNFFNVKRDHLNNIFLKINKEKKFNISLEFTFNLFVDNFEKYNFKYLVMRNEVNNTLLSPEKEWQIKLILQKAKSLKKKVVYI